MSREINSSSVVDGVAGLVTSANRNLPDDVLNSLNRALAKETSNTGRDVLRTLIENATLAKKEGMPICQDTGFAIVFLEIGESLRIKGQPLRAAVNEGVSKGYREGYLRKSVVRDPFDRVNTSDNTPADIIEEIVPGDRLKITFMAKGGGSENASALRMFRPSDDFSLIAGFVVDRIIEVGASACPPLIVGLGIGGPADRAMLLAKKALLRPMGKRNSHGETAKKEKLLLEMINSTGIGPAGFGGRTTALEVNIETFPCHIASLPVAMAVDCHAHRVARTTL